MDKYIKSILLIVFLLNLVYVTDANTATINAISCSQEHVQTAINSANNGDTVIVPAGKSTWSSPVFLSKKGITIQGAGIDQTIITDNTGTSWEQTPFWITGIEGSPFRITGFTFLCETSDGRGAIFIGGTCKNFRIDHCKFDGLEKNIGRGIWIQGYTYGVIDHCTFLYFKQGIVITGDGENSWKRPLTLGSVNAVYIEDCNFNFSAAAGENAIDAYSGARFVFRYSTLNGATIGHHGCDSGCYRSTHSYEYYNNNLSFTAIEWSALSTRGGSGVVFNNTVTGNADHMFILRYYRSCPSCATGSCSEQCSNWGICNGLNSFDGNLDTTGYPCIDQPGRSTDEDNDGIQDLQPVYEWNNTYKGGDGDIDIADYCPEIYNHIKENRDFYNDKQRPGYTPYTYPHPLVKETQLSDLVPPGNLHVVNVVE